MNPTEKYIEEICQFLSLDATEFVVKLKELRDKGWTRWGGGTVEITVAEILYVVTRLKNPEMVFDGGTNWGYSTAHLAQALKDNGKVPNNTMVSLDIDQAALKEAEVFLWERDIELDLRLMASVDWMKKVEGNGEYTPELDIVFIDTSHTYDYTKLEWEAMLPLLKDDSVIMFHDAYTDAYGVKQFLSELAATGTYKVLTLDTQPNTGLGIVIKNV